MIIEPSIKAILDKLTAVCYQLVNVDQEASVIESFIKQDLKKTDAILSKRLLTDEEFHTFESYIDAGFILRMQETLHCYTHIKIDLSEVDKSFYEGIGYYDIIDISNNILLKLKNGYRSQDIDYQKRSNIVKSFGMFYSMMDLFELFRKLKCEWISTKGIEDVIIDSCYNEEMQQFAAIIINKYEWYLSKIEDDCINMHFNHTSTFILQCWIALFAEYPSNYLVDKEFANNAVRQDDTQDSINLNIRIIADSNEIERLWKLRDELQKQKLQLIENKEQEAQSLIQAQLNEKEKFRIRFEIQKRKKEELESKRFKALINDIRGKSYHFIQTPRMIDYNYTYHYNYSRKGYDDYLDSRDCSETK